jgi:hypothetical protein
MMKRITHFEFTLDRKIDQEKQDTLCAVNVWVNGIGKQVWVPENKIRELLQGYV